MAFWHIESYVSQICGFKIFLIMLKSSVILILVMLSLSACKQPANITDTLLTPVKVTEKVNEDSDDPAIWIHPTDPSQSLIIGTDKGGDDGIGGLYVFNLEGKIETTKTVRLHRPNNVDIAYGLNINGTKTDIAVCTERNTNSIRVFSLPGMESIDQGGIPVFEDDTLRSPMGISLYTDKNTHHIYAIVGRKWGPQTNYLYQYLLYTDSTDVVRGKLVRKFGQFSGQKEIEAIAVDNELGFVYCSDEGVGVRKYYAHPDSSGTELALFATEGIADDHEGLSIYKADDGTGYILLSDQQANQFHIFPREGTKGQPHHHPMLKIIKTSTDESDGSEVTNVSLNDTFRHGLFVAMSTDGTFQLYSWEQIAGNDLFLAPDGVKKE
jgi:3-phytase